MSSATEELNFFTDFNFNGFKFQWAHVACSYGANETSSPCSCQTLMACLSLGGSYYNLCIWLFIPLKLEAPCGWEMFNSLTVLGPWTFLAIIVAVPQTVVLHKVKCFHKQKGLLFQKLRVWTPCLEIYHCVKTTSDNTFFVLETKGQWHTPATWWQHVKCHAKVLTLRF